jgi:hypothetical protein
LRTVATADDPVARRAILAPSHEHHLVDAVQHPAARAGIGHVDLCRRGVVGVIVIGGTPLTQIRCVSLARCERETQHNEAKCRPHRAAA